MSSVTQTFLLTTTLICMLWKHISNFILMSASYKTKNVFLISKNLPFYPMYTGIFDWFYLFKLSNGLRYQHKHYERGAFEKERSAFQIGKIVEHILFFPKNYVRIIENVPRHAALVEQKSNQLNMHHNRRCTNESTLQNQNCVNYFSLLALH